MERVLKYQFKIEDLVTIELPIGASVLLVGDQSGRPTLWALGDDSVRHEKREFFLFGTGHPVGSNLRHVASWQSPPFVWHMFE
jgi:hypothetical protein